MRRFLPGAGLAWPWPWPWLRHAARRAALRQHQAMLGEALQQWADATRLWQLGDACGTRSDQMADARQQQHQAEARLLALVQDAPRSDAPRRSLP